MNTSYTPYPAVPPPHPPPGPSHANFHPQQTSDTSHLPSLQSALPPPSAPPSENFHPHQVRQTSTGPTPLPPWERDLLRAALEDSKRIYTEAKAGWEEAERKAERLQESLQDLERWLKRSDQKVSQGLLDAASQRRTIEQLNDSLVRAHATVTGQKTQATQAHRDEIDKMKEQLGEASGFIAKQHARHQEQIEGKEKELETVKTQLRETEEKLRQEKENVRAWEDGLEDARESRMSDGRVGSQ